MLCPPLMVPFLPVPIPVPVRKKKRKPKPTADTASGVPLRKPREGPIVR
jgi:hypothetical protein